MTVTTTKEHLYIYIHAPGQLSVPPADAGYRKVGTSDHAVTYSLNERRKQAKIWQARYNHIQLDAAVAAISDAKLYKNSPTFQIKTDIDEYASIQKDLQNKMFGCASDKKEGDEKFWAGFVSLHKCK